MIKRISALLLMAGILLLSGCSAAKTTEPATAEETAEKVLQCLYRSTQEDGARLDAAMQEGEDSLKEYIRTKVGDCVTEEAIACIMENRLISRVINAWPDTEVQVETVELTPAYTKTEQKCYFQYQVEAGPEGETGNTFTGEVALSLIDEEWKVDSLS